MVVLSGSATSACPAELIAAEGASHVITALVLLDLGAAHRAEGHVVFVFVSPAFELLLHGFFTRGTLTVPFVAALETHLCGALRTRKLGGVLVRRTNVLLTTGLGAPSDQGVRLEALLVSEALVLLAELAQVPRIQDRLNLGLGDFRRLALEVEAFDLLDLSALDQAFELLDRAF